MRYILTVHLQSSYSHDNSRLTRFEEKFDADDLNAAVVIARAMLQSRKIRSEEGGNSVEYLNALLSDNHNNALWSSNLVNAQTRTETVVTPEHFQEEFTIAVDDDEISRSEQSA